MSNPANERPLPIAAIREVPAPWDEAQRAANGLLGRFHGIVWSAADILGKQMASPLGIPKEEFDAIGEECKPGPDYLLGTLGELLVASDPACASAITIQQLCDYLAQSRARCEVVPIRVGPVTAPSTAEALLTAGRAVRSACEAAFGCRELVRILSITFAPNVTIDPLEFHFAVSLWRVGCNNLDGAQLLISQLTDRRESLRRLFQHPITDALTAVRIAPLCQWLWDQFHSIDVHALRAALNLEFANATAEALSTYPAHPTNYFRLTGTHWEVGFGDERGVYDDDANIPRVVSLLRQPDTPVSALKLTGTDNRLAGITHTSQEASDREGSAAIERRCRDLVADIERARANGDEILAKELGSEFVKLTGHAKAEQGRGKRPRRIDGGSPSEKAKNTARKSLKRAYEVLRSRMPKLEQHLRSSIRDEGNNFAYRPSPSIPWEFC